MSTHMNFDELEKLVDEEDECESDWISKAYIKQWIALTRQMAEALLICHPNNIAASMSQREALAAFERFEKGE